MALFTQPGEGEEPSRISYHVSDPKELAWILFHEGFRCGYDAAQQRAFLPAKLEPYIRELYRMVSLEIQEQNSRHD